MNIIIDGHAFLNVSTSIVKNILSNDRAIGDRFYVNDLLSDDTFILKQASKDQFRKFALNYLGSILAPFKENVSSVFIVFDSKSWRKQFIKDHFGEHGDGDFAYKGNRKYDDKSHLFFEYFQNELIPILVEEYGVLTTRVPGAEGDDLIAYICEKLQEDICIWSVDKDLTQLLESKNRKIILLMPKMMTKFKKIYTTTDFDTIEKKEVDLFNFDLDNIDNSAVINVLNDLVTKDYQHFRIDPATDILLKIFGGDSSDMIPRVDPKLTPSRLLKVMDKLKEIVNWDDVKNLVDSDDPDFMTLVHKVICDTLKISDSGESLTIQNNITRNRTLIRLSTAVIPQSLVKSIETSIDLRDRKRFNYYKFKKNYKT